MSNPKGNCLIIEKTICDECKERLDCNNSQNGIDYCISLQNRDIINNKFYSDCNLFLDENEQIIKGKK